jgi:hypothetical protein
VKSLKGLYLFLPISVGLLIIILVLVGWLARIQKIYLIIIPIISVSLLALAIIKNSRGWATGISLISGILIGCVIILWSQSTLDPLRITGILCGSLGLSFLFIFFMTYILWKILSWWEIIPAGVCLALSGSFLNSDAGLLDFVFYIGIGLGISLLLWGIGAKLFGLIIAGSIVLTVAPGISFPWKSIGVTNLISQTGVMLVWFGLGWALITSSSRVIRDKFIWWPLIPGGILEMVGIGLFLGGNPNFTTGFLNNTTIMSLLLFGSYIFFLRMNFRK